MLAGHPGVATIDTVEPLYAQIDTLLDEVRREGDERLDNWLPRLARADFAESARNLAHYLTVRHRDLRPLQKSLLALGLSSLGRLESRVAPTLLAVRASLAALRGHPHAERPSAKQMFAGQQRLRERTEAIFGHSPDKRPIALMITCPSEAADDPAFMHALAERGVESIRINCAHDNAAAWQRMIDHVRAAERATGHRLRIFMDLAGPKIRTGMSHTPHGDKRVTTGALLAIVPAGGLNHADLPTDCFVVECTLPEAVAAAKAGDHVVYDDGRMAAKVERVERWGVVARIERCADKGVKLKPEKGLNFPETDIDVAALTAIDRTNLAFVAHHADGIGFSFVQSADDVTLLQDALAGERADWETLSLILKIETPRAVANLPDIVVQAAGRQPTAIMIARGDLAVEIGFVRLAEIQEEILWIAEAAQLPAIWATQVLEHLIKTGTPSRGEMTDAAMAARAECVMLNKGPFLLDAIEVLDTLLARMDAHQHKKTPQLRALKSW